MRFLQVDKIYIVCDNLAVQSIELIGDGVSYDRNFLTFGKERSTKNLRFLKKCVGFFPPTHFTAQNFQENEFFENDETSDKDITCCEYSLNLGTDMPNGILKSTITVTNSSGMELHFRWEKRYSRETGETTQMRDLPLEFLNIRPNSGIFYPCSAITFKITVRLTNLSSSMYRAVLQLFLEDIPREAVPREFRDKVEDCRNRRRLCKTVGIGISLFSSYCLFSMPI